MITRREFVAGVACAAVAVKAMGREADAENAESLIAPCGTYCGACPMYLDTLEDNKYQRMTRYFVAMSIGMKPPPKPKEVVPPKEGAKPKESAKPKAGVQMQMHCDGCLGGGRVPGHVPRCEIRICAEDKTKTRRCSECAEFPCSRITDFNNDEVLHRDEVIETLRRVRTMGIKDAAKYEADRWSCDKCRTRFSWYDYDCPTCKAPRPERLFKLRQA
jgi:hypothetical protein